MTDKAPKPLSPKMEAFCQSYARHGNATRAAKEAGYSEKTAYSQGHDLLKKPEIMARVSSIRTDRWKALHMSADELLAEAAKIARFSMARLLHVTPDGDPYLDLSKATEDDLAAITEVSIEDFTDGREVDDEGNTIKRDVRRVKAKAPNKLQAINLLMKEQGLLTDKVEMTVGEGFADAMEAALRRARKGRGDDDDEG
jgi:phage terminase small subunit